MRVRVVVPPQPIATPADVPGDHAPGDALVAAAIAAATEEFDGPSGWVGRCFGPQTLELTGCDWPDFSDLPYPPFIELVSIAYVDAGGDLQTWSAGGEPFPVDDLPSVRGRDGDVVIRYRAGYDDAVTGPMPARAKQAAILMANGLLLAAEEDGGLRSFQVDGAFSKSFNSPDMMERVRGSAAERLLQGLRVYR